MPAEQRLLGIDPGSRFTGYGILDCHGRHAHYRACGVIRLGDRPFPQRLRVIFDRLGALVDEYRPDVAAVEQVFVRRNPDSALKLGQARGAAICACLSHGLAIAEYTASSIKQAVTGQGGASKAQVQYMVRMLLSLEAPPPEDAADALAVALCHLHRASLDERLQRRHA